MGLLDNLHAWFVCQWKDGRYDVRLCYKNGSAIYLVSEYVIDLDLLHELFVLVTGGGLTYPQSAKYPHLPQSWPGGNRKGEAYDLLSRLAATARPWSCRVIVGGDPADMDTFTTLVSRVFAVRDLSKEEWGGNVRFLVVGRDRGWPWW